MLPEDLQWNGPPDVLQWLTASGWLKTIYWFEEIDSTNRAAKEFAGTNQSLFPALLVARRQTAGRGRHGRSWHSDSGTLTFSLLLSKDQLPDQSERWPQLALIAGLAVADTVAEIVPSELVKLKWPNDVYLDGGKLAGILIETVGPEKQHVVVGIGINVSTDLSAADVEVQQRARSLSGVSDELANTFSILPELVARFQHRLNEWVLQQIDIADAFSERCFLTGRMITIGSASDRMTGVCRGINWAGELMLASLEDDSVTTFSTGEIISWRD